MAVTIIVNGTERTVTADDGRSLLEVLRDDLGVTGPKFGCGEGACGACTVLIGRRAVTSCITPVAEAAGQRITTVEGLAEDGVLHPVQQAWLEQGAMQCGYCTPGWLTATAALLNRVTRPDDARIAAELAGNICRCCTYPRIMRAVRRAAELMEEPELLQPVPPGWSTRPRASPSTVVIRQPPRPCPGTRRPRMRPRSSRCSTTAWSRSSPARTARPVRPWVEQSAWVHVGADGSVTAFTGKVEAGQGTRTALGLLVAEELAVPPGSVRVVMGSTDVSPFDLGTFGSRSMPYAAPPLRSAAAAARELLREAAAERFGLPAGDLTVGGGMVAGPDGAPSIGFSDLLAGRAPGGAGTRRRAGDRAVSVALGRPPGARRPGRRRWSPASSTSLRISISTACGTDACCGRPRSVPPCAAPIRPGPRRCPGVSVVRDGEFIGVVAGSRDAARRAIGAIDASWDRTPQPGQDELAGYLRSHPIDGEGFSATFRHEQGDVDAALAAGPGRLDGALSAAYIAHVPLEPRSAVAAWRDGHLLVWTGTSTPFRARRELAEALDLPEDRVHVTVPDYGGGFGGKHGSSVAVEAARLARAAGGPVKVQWSRHEEFHWGYLRPAALIDVSASADASGRLTGWTHLNVNSGAVGIMTPYRVPHQRIVFQPADSPLPQGSYRALAATANNFARESHMDEVAFGLGLDPVEFRLAHLDDRPARRRDQRGRRPARPAAAAWPGPAA